LSMLQKGRPVILLVPRLRGKKRFGHVADKGGTEKEEDLPALFCAGARIHSDQSSVECAGV
jgi:hypothetical protein